MGFSVSELVIGLISSVSALVVGDASVVKQPQLDLSGKFKTSIEGSRTSGKEGKVDRSQMGRSFAEGGTLSQKASSSSGSKNTDLVSRGNYSSKNEQKNLSSQSQGGSSGEQQSSTVHRVPLQTQLIVGQSNEGQDSLGRRPSASSTEGGSSDVPARSQGIGGSGGFSSGGSEGGSSGGASGGGSSGSSVAEEKASVPSLGKFAGLSPAESLALQNKLDLQRKLLESAKKSSDKTPAQGPVKVNAPIQEQAPVRVDAPVQEQSPIRVDAPIQEQAPVRVDAPHQEQGPVRVDAPLQEQEPVRVDAPLQEQEPVRVDAPLQEQGPVRVDAPIQGQGVDVPIQGQGVDVPIQEQAPVPVAEDVEAPQVIAENIIASEMEESVEKPSGFFVPKLKKSSEGAKKETEEEQTARLKKEFAEEILRVRERIQKGKGSAKDRKGVESKSVLEEAKSATSELNTKLEENKNRQATLQKEIEAIKIKIQETVKRIEKASPQIEKVKAAIERAKLDKVKQNLGIRLASLESQQAVRLKIEQTQISALKKLQNQMSLLEREEQNYIKKIANVESQKDRDPSTILGESLGSSLSKNSKLISPDTLGLAKDVLEELLTERAYENLLKDTKQNKALVKKLASLDEGQVASLRQALTDETIPQFRLAKIAKELDNIISGFWVAKVGKVRGGIDALTGLNQPTTSPSLLTQASIDPAFKKRELEKDLRLLEQKKKEIEFKLGLAKSGKGEKAERARLNFSNEIKDLLQTIEEKKTELTRIETASTSLVSAVTDETTSAAVIADAAEVIKLAEEIKTAKKLVEETQKKEEDLRLKQEELKKKLNIDELAKLDEPTKRRTERQLRTKKKEVEAELKQIALEKTKKLNEQREKEEKSIELKSQMLIPLQEKIQVIETVNASREQTIRELEADLVVKKQQYEDRKSAGAKIIDLRPLTKASDEVLEQIAELKKSIQINGEIKSELARTLDRANAEIEEENRLKRAAQAKLEEDKLANEAAALRETKRKKLFTKIASPGEGGDIYSDMKGFTFNKPKAIEKSSTTSEAEGNTMLSGLTKALSNTVLSSNASVDQDEFEQDFDDDEDQKAAQQVIDRQLEKQRQEAQTEAAQAEAEKLRQEAQAQVEAQAAAEKQRQEEEDARKAATVTPQAETKQLTDPEELKRQAKELRNQRRRMGYYESSSDEDDEF